MSVNSCIYWHALIDAMRWSLVPTFLTCWTAFGWGSRSGGSAFFSILKKKPLAECCGQTKQKTEKFTVHRCTAVQDGSKNLSQRVMADCGLWLSGGISSSDKDKPLHYAEKSIFFDDTVWNCCCCSCSCYWCVCLSASLSVRLSICLCKGSSTLQSGAILSKCGSQTRLRCCSSSYFLVRNSSKYAGSMIKVPLSELSLRNN